MPVRISCPTCKKEMEPYLDKKSDLVFCDCCNADCNANHFLKMQLKAFKQYREPKIESFAVICNNCNHKGTPVLKKNNVCCAKCSKPITTIGDAFKKMLIEFLPTAQKDV